MKQFPSESVDLIYLDPPFNSNANYNILFGAGNGVSAQLRAFTDTWHWNDEAAARVERMKKASAFPAEQKLIIALHSLLGNTGMMSYLSYMTERLAQIERVLKNTGSIYLHCDSTASHYLKIVLDHLFNAVNFRNHIVWRRKKEKHNLARKRMPRICDTIFWYVKSDKAKNSIQYTPYDPDYIEGSYKYRDERGIYATFPCTNERGGNKPYEFRGITRAWRFSVETMQKMYDDGMLVQPKPNSPFRYKKYLESAKGRKVDDLWLDIHMASGEDLNYPTQKPVALLERIIETSSKKGDLVLDPFCGCGTTIMAAHKLKRKWAGIDISSYAIDVINDKRLTPIGIEPNFAGIPYDLASARRLAKDKPFGFETWAIQRIDGLVPNTKQTGDGGLDGRGLVYKKKGEDIPELVIAQVKGSSFNAEAVRSFLGLIERGVDNPKDVAMGIFITCDKVKSPKIRANFAALGKIKVGAREFPRAQLWSIEEHFENIRPDLPALVDPYTGQEMAKKVVLNGMSGIDE